MIPEYQETFLFLDNDPAGERATKEVLCFYDNVTDQSNSYKAFKDLNEKLNRIQRDIIVQ